MLGIAFDRHRDRTVAQTTMRNLARPADRPENRALGNRRCQQPGLQCCDRAVLTPTRNRDCGAFRLLIRFGPADCHQKSFFCSHQVRDVQGHQLGPAQGSCKTRQNEGTVPEPNQCRWCGPRHRFCQIGDGRGLATTGRAENPANPAKGGSNRLCCGGRLVPGSEMPKLNGPKSPAQSRWPTPPANLEGQESANNCRFGGEGFYISLAAPARKYCEIGRIGAAGCR